MRPPGAYPSAPRRSLVGSALLIVLLVVISAFTSLAMMVGIFNRDISWLIYALVTVVLLALTGMVINRARPKSVPGTPHRVEVLLWVNVIGLFAMTDMLFAVGMSMIMLGSDIIPDVPNDGGSAAGGLFMLILNVIPIIFSFSTTKYVLTHDSNDSAEMTEVWKEGGGGNGVALTPGQVRAMAKSKELQHMQDERNAGRTVVPPPDPRVMQRIGEAWIPLLPAGNWQRSDLFWSEIAGRRRWVLTGTDTAGVVHTVNMTQQLDEAVACLHVAMSAPGRGAFLSVQLWVTPRGVIEMSYNWDRRFWFGMHPGAPWQAPQHGEPSIPSDAEWRAEAQLHPRSPELLPMWWRAL